MTDWTAIPAPVFGQDSNAPAPALSLPVGAVGERHVGRKVRVYGRVVEYDPKTAVLVIADPAPTQLAGEDRTGQIPTLAVDIRVVTAGVSTASTISLRPDGGAQKGGKIKLLPGMGVGAVGWVERAAVRPATPGATRSDAFADPPPVVVSAIWLANEEAILPRDSTAPLLWRGETQTA